MTLDAKIRLSDSVRCQADPGVKAGESKARPSREHHGFVSVAERRLMCEPGTASGNRDFNIMHPRFSNASLMPLAALIVAAVAGLIYSVLGSGRTWGATSLAQRY
jgi:hypothetical protein